MSMYARARASLATLASAVAAASAILPLPLLLGAGVSCSSGVFEGSNSGLSGGGQSASNTGTDTADTQSSFDPVTSASQSGTDGTSAGPTTNMQTSGWDPSDSDSDSDSGPSTSDTTTSSTSGTSGGLDCGVGVGEMCEAATNLGPVSSGETVSSLVSTVQPSATNWYRVQFPLAGGRPGIGSPTIVFEQNTNEAFAFEVNVGACGQNPTNCLEEGGVATDITQWTFHDIPTDGLTMLPGYVPPDDAMEPWPDEAFVRVYRVDNELTCETYQLTAKRP